MEMRQILELLTFIFISLNGLTPVSAPEWTDGGVASRFHTDHQTSLIVKLNYFQHLQ